MSTKPILPPGGPLDVVFSFDTTGSMYSWLEEIRGRIQDMIQRLQADLPGIRIAVMAHGDYCDEATYVTKWTDFTTDVAKLCQFVQTVERTEGGDAPECYELVLRQVRTELSWTPGSRRVLVMIGDDIPHEPQEACNKDRINWRCETKDLALAGVTIYGVQCGKYVADAFYRSISVATGGKHLRLEDFGSLFDTLMAVCYRESSDTAMLCNYEQEVRGRCGTQAIARDIDAIFASLRDEVTVSSDAPIRPRGLGAKKLSIAKAKSTTSKPLVTKTKKSITPVKAKTQTKSPKIASLKARSPNTVLNKYKLKHLPLLKRENVPEVNFKFRFINWSKWILCLTTSNDVTRGQRSQWQPRGDKPGQRLKHLPITNSTSRGCTFVEVSVQINGLRSKKHVVYSQRLNRCLKNVNLEDELLHDVSSQVDMVLQAGCNIYIRYCSLGQREKMSVVKEIKRYDYAWKCPWIKRTGARNVIKSGVTISE